MRIRSVIELIRVGIRARNALYIGFKIRKTVSPKYVVVFCGVRIRPIFGEFSNFSFCHVGRQDQAVLCRHQNESVEKLTME